MFSISGMLTNIVFQVLSFSIHVQAVMEKMKDSWFRTVVSMFMKTLGSGPFTSRTVHELLWGYEDPLLEKAAGYTPGLDKAFGLMYKASTKKREFKLLT